MDWRAAQNGGTGPENIFLFSDNSRQGLRRRQGLPVAQDYLVAMDYLAPRTTRRSGLCADDNNCLGFAKPKTISPRL